MRDAQPRPIYLKDYQPPAFLIETTDLDISLHDDHALVTSLLRLRRNPAASAEDGDLVLHGGELELVEIHLDDRRLAGADFELASDCLRIPGVPDQFTLRCVTRIRPHENTSLEGLYRSRTMFCTQCEAEGFRKITYYLDRPDVMSVFSVRLEADKSACPVLLSNGNLSGQGGEGGRHWTLWHDPFPKPAYLFAVVAGDLQRVADRFTTCSGREVDLHIYVEPKDLDKCGHAMLALKNAMRWDEEVYGREYDLDLYNIVAVDDFNMGAMENKSLNIFNTSCVLANPATTTDVGFQRVEAVVAHEYFHNWSGNRVTCRDWFQLSLKEGFTVFRDAEFSSDMGSRTVKRIQDVSLLRTAQFAEDAGPMSHPVRPDSYIEISNFYTLTVYEKGAEVVRMIHRLLGPELFRAGSDLYFQRHDGQAVTCEDFVRAMEDASGLDLGQFRRWYSQAGTPQLDMSGDWEPERGAFTLHVRQSCPATPELAEKQPFLVPLEVGLLGEAGAMRLTLESADPDPELADNTSLVLNVTEAEQSFTFVGLSEKPVPSLLRGFTAPVKSSYPYSRSELAFIMSRDDDGFCRWDAGQALAVEAIADMQAGAKTVDDQLLDGIGRLLDDASLDPAMVAEMLRLPTESYLAELVEKADVHAIHAGREAVRSAIAVTFEERLRACYERSTVSGPYQPSGEQIALRSLRNACLGYLALAGPAGLELAQAQYASASNMTDQQAALVAIVNNGDEAAREEVLWRFYEQWSDEALVVNLWLQVQATCPRENNLQKVRRLMEHEAFNLRNPNKVRSLIGAFCSANPVNFHAVDGSGYELLKDTVVTLNSSNPQLAARLLSPLTRWRRFAVGGDLMRAALEEIAAEQGLSPDVYEVVAKSLK
jgi:aminopeptidase N